MFLEFAVILGDYHQKKNGIFLQPLTCLFKMCNKDEEQGICNILYNFMGSSEEMCQFYGDS